MRSHSLLVHRVALGLVASGAITITSCSDPVPPSAQGAFTAEFGNAPGNTCPATTPSAVISVGAVTEKDKVPAIDGENGAGVACRVVPIAGGLAAEGSISYGSSSFTMNGVTFAGTEGTGRILLRGANTAGTYAPSAGSNCTFKMLQGDSGRIWATFECPTMERSGVSNSLCSVSEGIVVFENCVTD